MQATSTRGLMKMVRQILDGSILAPVSLRLTPGEDTVAVTRPYDLVEGPFVEVLDALFDGAILQHQKRPVWRLPIGRGNPSPRILRPVSSGTGSGFSRRMARVVWRISKMSVCCRPYKAPSRTGDVC